MIPTWAWAVMAIYILALGTGIWLRNRPASPVPEYTPEAPSVPRDFKPRKRRAVKDRLAWRRAHPMEAQAIARHARQLHYHDAEEAEARHA